MNIFLLGKKSMALLHRLLTWFLQAALRTSHGRRPPGTSGGRATTAARLTTGAPRGTTAFGPGGTAIGARPTTGFYLKYDFSLDIISLSVIE